MINKSVEEYNKKNAENIAYQKIKDAIRDNSILPGRKLSEAALGEILGMVYFFTPGSATGKTCAGLERTSDNIFLEPMRVR